MRKHLRRLEHVWVDRQIYLVTVCSHGRSPVLATDALAAELANALREVSRTSRWRVGRYVVMPDHMHFFCCPAPDAARLSDFVRRWKTWTTRRAWRLGHSGRLWQAEFFDHLLRDDESYAPKWDYVAHNPVRAGLCQTPEQWAYQGEITPLEL